MENQEKMEKVEENSDLTVENPEVTEPKPNVTEEKLDKVKANSDVTVEQPEVTDENPAVTEKTEDEMPLQMFFDDDELPLDLFDEDELPMEWFEEDDDDDDITLASLRTNEPDVTVEMEVAEDVKEAEEKVKIEDVLQYDTLGDPVKEYLAVKEFLKKLNEFSRHLTQNILRMGPQELKKLPKKIANMLPHKNLSFMYTALREANKMDASIEEDGRIYDYANLPPNEMLEVRNAVAQLKNIIRQYIIGNPPVPDQ